MFKIEVNVKGEIKHKYWMNKHKDNFLKYLPKHFTAEYGEIITKDDLTVYKIDEDMLPLLEGKLKQSEFNSLEFEIGKIQVKRKDKAKYKDGDKVKLEEYEAEALKRDDIFKDAKDKDAVKVKAPKTVKEDLLDENGDPVLDEQGKVVKIDYVIIDSTESLSQDAESLELDLVGIPLTRWSYDDKGNFLGNN